MAREPAQHQFLTRRFYAEDYTTSSIIERTVQAQLIVLIGLLDKAHCFVRSTKCGNFHWALVLRINSEHNNAGS
eukprot:scaffold1688_cov42-Prasinocladus_malaysianus.AAC.1